MKSEDWVEQFAAEVGQPAPTEEEFSAILDLAAVAAHSSERTAAPVAAWLAGKSGRSLEEAQKLADGIG